jgi:hypothetical protein
MCDKLVRASGFRERDSFANLEASPPGLKRSA